ncbi:hypothetical protein HYZ64_02925, partial [Candidatus Berkelbacteria bacterium]|nr:hypothetical protein [Candidatus Berkelbacteria bacterium]
RLLIDNQPARPFNAKSLAPAGQGSMEMSRAIVELSRLTYGKDRKAVEAAMHDETTVAASTAADNALGAEKIA